jgi:hypothetical protein
MNAFAAEAADKIKKDKIHFTNKYIAKVVAHVKPGRSVYEIAKLAPVLQSLKLEILLDQFRNRLTNVNHRSNFVCFKMRIFNKHLNFMRRIVEGFIVGRYSEVPK